MEATAKGNDQLAYSSGFDEVTFRSEVRAFCEEQIPENIRAKIRRHEYFSKQDRVQWQKLLNEQGWFAGDWPEQYGGQSWGALQRFIWVEELERAGTPWLAYFGVAFVGPVIFTYGSDAQKARYLEDIRNSDTWWCQGFSEPGAGSDLAALKTRAVLDGDHYVVSGQKTWTTMAQWADMMFCLVRTQVSEHRQAGISFLLIDLNSPGVSVRPIETIDGCHHINEVFLDNVRVPKDNLIGEEGQGWEIAKFIVGRERLLVAEVGKARRLLDYLDQLGQTLGEGRQPAGNCGAFRFRLAELEVDYLTLRATAYAAIESFDKDSASELSASLLKIRGSELQQSILDMVVETMGHAGHAFQAETLNGERPEHVHLLEESPGLLFEHLHSRATTIYGGSNEIQRSIIAKTYLGL